MQKVYWDVFDRKEIDMKIFDSTLRDGSHAIKQALSKKNIKEYCSKIDDVGEYVVFVGHGNGLGASSIQMGISQIDEMEMLKVAREKLKKTRLGGFITVGFGTIDDFIAPAIECGVDLFSVAVHCTESDISKRHIEYIVKRKKEAYGVLMNYHMTDTNGIVESAKRIEDYGAKGLILMDSAGASLPEMVDETFLILKDKVSIELGFHAHNNLGLAVSNTNIAVKRGATIIDGTLQGFGSGAGNCQIEAIVSVLEKQGIHTGLNFEKLMKAGEYIREGMQYEKGIDNLCIVSGLAGVVSTFRHKVEYFAEQYDVSPYEVYWYLGKRKAIAGQDDLVLDVVTELAKDNERRKNNG